MLVDWASVCRRRLARSVLRAEEVARAVMAAEPGGIYLVGVLLPPPPPILADISITCLKGVICSQHAAVMLLVLIGHTILAIVNAITTRYRNTFARAD